MLVSAAFKGSEEERNGEVKVPGWDKAGKPKADDDEGGRVAEAEEDELTAGREEDDDEGTVEEMAISLEDEEEEAEDEESSAARGGEGPAIGEGEGRRETSRWPRRGEEPDKRAAIGEEGFGFPYVEGGEERRVETEREEDEEEKEEEGDAVGTGCCEEDMGEVLLLLSVARVAKEVREDGVERGAEEEEEADPRGERAAESEGS